MKPKSYIDLEELGGDMKPKSYIGSNLVRRLRQLKRQGGFTLIELLVVVAILGALAAIAVPAVAKFAGKGKQAANKTELLNVQTAIDAAIAEYFLTSVTPKTSGPAITDFSSAGGYDADPSASSTVYLYTGAPLTTYMRQILASTGVGYCVDAGGMVTQENMLDGETNCPAP